MHDGQGVELARVESGVLLLSTLDGSHNALDVGAAQARKALGHFSNQLPERFLEVACGQRLSLIRGQMHRRGSCAGSAGRFARGRDESSGGCFGLCVCVCMCVCMFL